METIVKGCGRRNDFLTTKDNGKKSHGVLRNRIKNNLIVSKL